MRLRSIIQFALLAILGLVWLQSAYAATGKQLMVTDTDQLMLPVQGLQVPQVLLSHATDCTGGGITGARYGNICIDRDDFRMWECVQTACTSPAHWRDISAASSIRNTPAGTIAATDMQAAINELDTDPRMADKRALHTHATDCKGGTITARLGEMCVDLDDGHQWVCNSATCTTTNWVDDTSWTTAILRSYLPAGWGLLTTHATDCPTNTPTGRLNDRCIDLDDGREWRCTLTSCTVAGNWTLVTPGILTLEQQASAPPPPPAGKWAIYPLSTGIFIRDAAGNIRGPLDTGGVGGTGLGFTATLVIPTNITLSGEQTFETVTTSTSRVFVAGQTLPTENGFYVTGPAAWTRASDALSATSFTAGTLVTITGGLATSVGNKGSVWMINSSGTYGSSPLTATKSAAGPAGELIASRSTITTSVPNGTIGSDANGRVPWNRAGSYVALDGLSATSQITPTAQTIGIENAGAGNLLLTSGDPRITGCSAGADGIHIYLVGLSTTKTVTIPDGQGVLLAGALGSGAGAAGGVTIGMAPGGTSAEFRCNGGTGIWEQVSYTTLQQAKNAGASITNAEIEASGVRIGGVNNFCMHYGSTQKCYCSGVQCLNITFGPLPLGGKVEVLNNASAPIFVVNENGAISGLSAGPSVLGGNNNQALTCSSGGDTHQTFPVGRTLTDMEMRVPRTGSAAKLHVRFLNPVPPGQTATLAVRKNGAVSALSCSVVGGAGVGAGEVVGTTTDLECSNTANAVSLIAGTDRINFQVVCSGGSSDIADFSFAFVIE